MKTKVFEISSPNDDKQTAAAAEIIKNGGLLAIPTETVYGLGADGLNAEAVKKIFAAKGRPQDNPLILHVPSKKWIERYCTDVPQLACDLADKFWPGPLTMVLKRKPIVPDETTAGLDTVGMRCPQNAVTRAIIESAGVPIAAPSANISGRPSCTCIADVLEDMDGKIDGAVDGGQCSVGVESTIIDLTVSPPQLLRPGGISPEQLREAIGEITIDKAVTALLKDGEKPKAPGMKYRHYAPKAPVTVVKGAPAATAEYIRARAGQNTGVICFDEFSNMFSDITVQRMGRSDDKAEQARRVFDALRAFDSSGVSEIYAQCPDESGLGFAIANRLKKAAGFHVIDLEDMQ